MPAVLLPSLPIVRALRRLAGVTAAASARDLARSQRHLRTSCGASTFAGILAPTLPSGDRSASSIRNRVDAAQEIDILLAVRLDYWDNPLEVKGNSVQEFTFRGPWKQP